MRVVQRRLLSLFVSIVSLGSILFCAVPVGAEIRYYSSVPISVLRGGQDVAPTQTPSPQVTPTPIPPPTVTPTPPPFQDPVLVQPVLLELATLVANHPDQGRVEIIIDPVLVEVAAARAADMANRDYFGHTDPDGLGPNYHALEAGYPLPDWYSSGDTANNIESIAAGQWTAEEVLQDWINSPAHCVHLMGGSDFFSGQTHVGLGYAENINSTYRRYWVFVSAHSD